MSQEQGKSLNYFPNLSALCKKDERQKRSLEKLLKHKPNVVKSLDIYAQNIETYLRDQRKRIAYLKKKEEQPQLESLPHTLYDEAVIQQFNRVKAKQFYLQQSQKRISQKPSPEVQRDRTPSKYFDKNYTPLKRQEKYEIPSLQPVASSPPKELKPIQFKFYYHLQQNDPSVRQVLNSRQWQEVPSNCFAHFQWLNNLFDFSSLIKQEAVSKRQMVSVTEFHQDWSSKYGLYATLCSISPEHAFQVVPPGFVLNFQIAQWAEELDSIQDYFIQKEKCQRFTIQAYIPNKGGQAYNRQIAQLLSDPPKIWIGKPACGSGVTIIRNLNHLQQMIITQSKDQKQFVIQKYIDNPLLYGGKKFDLQIRVFVNQENQIFIYSEPNGRTCTAPFDLNSDDPKVHSQASQLISNKDLKEFLEGQGIDIINEAKKSITLIPCKINRRLRKYCIQFFDFNYMIDETKKLFLIGIKANPTNLTVAELDGAFKLSLDKVFPTASKNDETSKWMLVY